MEVILLETVRNLGRLGDKVSVKPGYGRNFLIPKNKAVFATAKNIENFELRRADLEKKEQSEFDTAQKRADKLNTITVVVSALASDEGKLYGSVGANEIQDALKEQSIEVSKREIVMVEGPIHSVGDFVVEIHVHSDIIANVSVQVVSSK